MLTYVNNPVYWIYAAVVAVFAVVGGLAYYGQHHLPMSKLKKAVPYLRVVGFFVGFGLG